MLLTLRSERAQKVRAKGLVPGVIYGNNFSTQKIEANAKELIKTFQEKGHTLTFEVQLEKQKHMALFKEVQRDPLTQDIIHFDLQKVSATDLVTAPIPIHLIGRDVVEGHRFVIQLLLDHVECEYPVAKAIPSLAVDITNLTAGDSVLVSDLQLPEGFVVKEDPGAVIVSISHPTIMETEEENAEPTSE